MTADIGVLHPGAMGAAVGAALVARRPGGVWWCTEGRSTATTDRAARVGLRPVSRLGDLTERCGVLISVCPPDQAVAMARLVAATGFTGRYVDANAVAPATAVAVASLLPDVVDGGIVGPPPHRPGSTRLYLSGPGAGDVASLFEGSALEAQVVGERVGAASALKMGYAAWTKGTAALILAIRALARREGVEEGLLAEWDRSQPDLGPRSEASAGGAGPKAWRFEGEMREIADTFDAAGLPGGFHRAAAEVYQRLAPLKDHGGPSLDQVLELLLDAPSHHDGGEPTGS